MTRCVRLHAIRVARHAKPLIRRTERFVKRHVVHSSMVSFVPSLLNDTIIHHKGITPAEILQVATDDLSVTTVTALVTILIKLV